MSLKKIVESAMNKDALDLKDAFAEEMAVRVAAALEEKYKKVKEEEESDEDESEEEDEDESDEEESDEDELDEKACVREMKKLHASACSKNEMYKTVKEKYGCTKEKFESLYASNCK